MIWVSILSDKSWPKSAFFSHEQNDYKNIGFQRVCSD
jgi:hypothetical protein